MTTELWIHKSKAQQRLLDDLLTKITERPKITLMLKTHRDFKVTAGDIVIEK